MVGAWEVTAGVVAGEPMAEFTRQFHYSERDYFADLNGPAGKPGRMLALHDRACEYGRLLLDPRRANWVNLHWYRTDQEISQPYLAKVGVPNEAGSPKRRGRPRKVAVVSDNKPLREPGSET